MTLTLVCIVAVLSCDLKAQILPDQVSPLPAQDSLSTNASSDSLKNTKPVVIKKDLDATAQVRMGAAVMTFIIVVMVLANNFNPD